MIFHKWNNSKNKLVVKWWVHPLVGLGFMVLGYWSGMPW